MPHPTSLQTHLVRLSSLYSFRQFSSNQQPQSLQIPQLDREQVKEYVNVSQYSDEKSLKILTKYVPKTAAETDLREKKNFSFGLLAQFEDDS